MEVKVLDAQGKATSTKVTLSDSIFGIEPNDHAIYLDVKQYLANQRQGTHKAKERAEIAGSTKKIKKQKGTGTARVGNIKSGTRVGGGRIFGPRPRNYSFKLNIKLKRLARKSALAYKAQNDALMVVEDMSMASPKTADFKAFLGNLKLENEKVLVVVGSQNDNVYLSSRNLQRAKVVTADSLNTYDVLNARKVVLAASSVEAIEKILN
ncbi:LSU ribosomal protein L4P [Lishizhenia tianjinensis]|jgi:large subunit ribosomal protein L4|uniref:Large ribosomal subunit protein uL4 n=2 Tax=Lishizhenia TaxID=559293 RepID=A0A1I7A6D0_9FLAO|nr:50S ribosomal protein L4 [Lishizhenia tianjinensis]SFT70483.1 LSU ribosomal protein L4P [Lishizhenia tianjinensis]